MRTALAVTSLTWTLGLFFLSGCGGTTTSTGPGDASVRDAAPDSSPGEDASGCPGVQPIPTEYLYACDAGAPADAGCPAQHGDSKNQGKFYPLGCNVTMPEKQPFCGDSVCCGPLVCPCENTPLGNGFTCPL